jgi:peptidoglycan/LPS O-acetylase OafA/YrhL
MTTFTEALPVPLPRLVSRLTRRTMQRHYGLDWLRIGAFAILILYHVGMVFVPWDFHVKLARENWVAIPMMASNPWRLALLFVVSGYASRALFTRGKGAGGFARNRSARLLIPLVFGAIVVIPPQPWVELVTKYDYPASFAHFWTHDYFRFGTLAGIVLPTWQHLWFVVCLWVYTMLLTGIMTLSSGGLRAAAQRGFDRLFGTVAALIVPTIWLLLVSAVLFVGARETHALFDDGVAHATYLPAFLFGFALGGSPRTLAVFARWWKVTAPLAILAYAVVAGVEARWSGTIPPRPWGTVFSLARGVEGWMAIAALIGIAETFWNRDHRWRPMLTEAVFPFYIIHQTVIVVVAYWIMPLGLPGGAAFAILVAATVAGCWGFYLAGRAVPWLRPLIGLRARRPAGGRVAPAAV